MAAPHSFDDKTALRRVMQQRRARCDPARGLWLAAHVFRSALLRPAQAIAGFWPLEGEIDLRPLLLALAGRGHTVALPNTPGPGAPLDFHRWRPGMTLVRGRFGTRHPPPDPVVPDLLLVPLLAFDRTGHRLGYGGGYYDRTLARWPGIAAIGCAFACQEIQVVPTSGHDIPLHAIATETSLIVTD